MKELGNENHIVYLTLYNERISDEFIHYDKKTFLGFTIREAGFYYQDPFGGLSPMERIPKDMYIKGNSILEKPHILLEYSNGREKKIYFNTELETHMFVKNNFQGNNWKIYD